VIIATFGRATVLQASPFPEWQDERRNPARSSGTPTNCIEEHP
jgi:hypothetical protein